MEDLKERQVVQDNALISASYAMELNEKRLLIALISKVDSTSKAWKEGRLEIEVTALEFAELYNLDKRIAYKQLNDASKGLFNRSVRIFGDSRKGKEIRWISAREYDEGNGRVLMTFANPILKYLTSLFDQFTQYDLLGVSGLRSVHSVRLYELAMQFKSTGWRTINLEDLKRSMGIEGSYDRWVDLKKHVLDKSVIELNMKSDLLIGYEPIKTGRKVTSIKLFAKIKDQLELEW